jgi:hypothetical protein
VAPWRRLRAVCAAVSNRAGFTPFGVRWSSVDPSARASVRHGQSAESVDEGHSSRKATPIAHEEPPSGAIWPPLRAGESGSHGAPQQRYAAP